MRGEESTELSRIDREHLQYVVTVLTEHTRATKIIRNENYWRVKNPDARSFSSHTRKETISD